MAPITHLVSRIDPSAISRATTNAFSRRLFELMSDRGLSQSDLARLIWKETTDSKGYKVARNRDRIGNYLRGKSFPEPHNLKLLADALGVTPDDLVPQASTAPVDREAGGIPDVSIVTLPGQPDKAMLVLNRVLPLSAITEILAIITREG